MKVLVTRLVRDDFGNYSRVDNPVEEGAVRQLPVILEALLMLLVVGVLAFIAMVVLS